MSSIILFAKGNHTTETIADWKKDFRIDENVLCIDILYQDQ